MKKKYFEGWYMKHCHNGHTFAVIPGISRDRQGRKEAFIQVIMADRSYYIPFDYREFYSDPGRFYVRIGCNEFSLNGISLYIHHPNLSLKGKIRYHGIHPLNADIMGPVRFLPGMECSHGVLSMAHTLTGDVIYNGNHLEFTGGTGYIETNKGSSFPEMYLWTQCNTFENRSDPHIVMAAATIPYMGMKINGCISAVHYHGREYRLATYSGARIVSLRSDQLVLVQRNLRLSAQLLKSDEKPLFAPDKGGMRRKIYEDLSGTVRYRFYEDGQLVFRATSEWASFEYSRSSS